MKRPALLKPKSIRDLIKGFENAIVECIPVMTLRIKYSDVTSEYL